MNAVLYPKTTELEPSNEALQAMNRILAQRAQQQQAVAELGLLALSNQDLAALFSAIVARVCQVLGLEFCKILALQPGGEHFLLRAGHGWHDGLVGHATVPARDGSQAAYTLLVSGPVIVEDAEQETRFTPSHLLTEHNICCGMSVVIQGRQGPYGVLGAHSRVSHLFVGDDVNFLQAVANLLAQAINRKQIEADLQRGEALRQLALAGAQLGTWTYDLLTGELSGDERCRVILGLAPAAPLTPATLLQTIHPDDRQHVYETALLVMAPNLSETTRLEARVCWPDGTVRWWVTRWGISLEASDNGTQVVHVAGIIMDISARKETEAQLRTLTATLERRVEERTAELARSNKELDRFAYVASHDLSAPLRAIQQLASWVLEDVSDLLPAESHKHLVRLQQRADRMEQLLRDLLLYSRAGRQRDHYVAVDVAELIRDIELTVALPSGFSVVVEAPLPTLFTERAPLELVFRNLIGNAVKHHHCPELGKVWIAARQAGAWVEFTVRDNGPGIAPEFHERIFEMFQTLRPRDAVEGSGMGLAIVKKTIESLNGTIGVESALGQGALFRFTWPVLLAA